MGSSSSPLPTMFSPNIESPRILPEATLTESVATTPDKRWGELPIKHEEKDRISDLSEAIVIIHDKVETLEASVRALHDLQQEIAIRLADQAISLENLSEMVVTNESLNKAFSPIQKAIEDVKASLSVMKAVPVSSVPPKRTEAADKGKQAQRASQEDKPNEATTSRPAPHSAIRSIQELIASRKRAGSQMDKAAEGSSTTPK